MKQPEVDIFSWANNLFQYKEDLQVELFLINKNSVLYRTKYDATLNRQLRPLLIDSILEYIMNGAGTGLVVRGFEEAEQEKNVLQFAKAEDVGGLQAVMSWFDEDKRRMDEFSQKDHDLKRIKGVIACFSHPELSQKFYVIKAIGGANILNGVGAWMIGNDRFSAFQDSAAIRMPADNQLLLVDGDLFVFSQSKLETLFGYNAKKNAIADKKVAQIEASFKLSFPDGLDMQKLVKGNKAIIAKLQNIDPSAMTQEQLLEYADTMGIELMQDDNEAIIIMDSKDLSHFVNLLNDDYSESPVTGMRYEIKSKKVLREESRE
jgi:hypothetical protein